MQISTNTNQRLYCQAVILNDFIYGRDFQ